MILACSLLAFWTVQIIGQEGHNFIRDYDTKQHRLGDVTLLKLDLKQGRDQVAAFRGTGSNMLFLPYLLLCWPSYWV